MKSDHETPLLLRYFDRRLAEFLAETKVPEELHEVIATGFYAGISEGIVYAKTMMRQEERHIDLGPVH